MFIQILYGVGCFYIHKGWKRSEVCAVLCWYDLEVDIFVFQDIVILTFLQFQKLVSQLEKHPFSTYFVFSNGVNRASLPGLWCHRVRKENYHTFPGGIRRERLYWLVTAWVPVSHALCRDGLRRDRISGVSHCDFCVLLSSSKAQAPAWDRFCPGTRLGVFPGGATLTQNAEGCPSAFLFKRSSPSHVWLWLLIFLYL